MLSKMDYAEIKQSLEDQEEAIRRHNEQRQERVNLGYAKTFPRNCPVVERTADGKEVGNCTFGLDNGYCPRHGAITPRIIAEAEKRQRQQILRALDALHRGNHDDAKRILEAM